MEYTFEPLSPVHQGGVMEIYNYYIEQTTAAYREQAAEKEYYQNFLDTAETHPGYAVRYEGDRIIGFCLLKPHIALSTFSETADIMYFLHHEYTGRGIGASALGILEEAGKKIGIRKLTASICSENEQSITFHLKHGFTEYGRFPDIGKKFGRYFSIVWMGKELGLKN